MTPTDNFEVSVVKTVEELNSLRTFWGKEQWHPNADLEYFATVLESRKEILRPHVVVLSREGRIVSILVGRVETKPFMTEIGYTKFRASTVRCLTFIYGGLIGDDSLDCVRALMDSVLSSLREAEVDVVFFNQLNVNSTLYRSVQQGNAFLLLDRFPISNSHWRVNLPGTFDEFLRQRSANTRHNLRRYSKRVKDSFGEGLVIKQFREPCEMAGMMSDTEKIAAKSYHRGLEVGFVHNEETRRLMELGARNHWLRAYILYIGGKPAAFWNGLQYKGTFFTGTTGFDPAYTEYRLGTFLLQKLLQDLCNENQTNAIDFGFGDAQYKRDLCDQNWKEVSILIFAPKLKGIMLYVMRTASLATSHFGQKFLTKVGLLQRVKKIWRDRLKQKEKT